MYQRSESRVSKVSDRLRDAFLEIDPTCEFEIRKMGVDCDIFIPSRKLALRLPLPPDESDIRNNMFLNYASKQLPGTLEFVLPHYQEAILGAIDKTILMHRC